MNETVGLILFLVMAGAVIVLGVLELIARLLPDDPQAPVSILSPAPPLGLPRDYVTHGADLTPDRPADPGLSAGLSGLSAAQRGAVQAYMLDRSRANLVTLAVALGARTGELRAELKGDTGRIGEEVRAARAALGLDDPDGQRYVTVGDGGHRVPIGEAVAFRD